MLADAWSSFPVTALIVGLASLPGVSRPYIAATSWCRIGAELHATQRPLQHTDMVHATSAGHAAPPYIAMRSATVHVETNSHC